VVYLFISLHVLSYRRGHVLLMLAVVGCHGNRQLTENSLTSLSAGTFRGLTNLQTLWVRRQFCLKDAKRAAHSYVSKKNSNNTTQTLINNNNKQPMDSDAQLTGTQSGREECPGECPDPHTGLQHSTCSGYDLCHPG